MHQRLVTLNKMAAARSSNNSPSKPRSRTAVNGRNGLEDLKEIGSYTLEFGVGTPSYATMCKLKPLLAEATKLRMESEDDSQMFQYGALRGDHVFVQELAKFLTERYEYPVNSDDIMCTAGATNGLMMLACTIFKPGDYIFIEDPTYFQALRIFRDDLGMNIVPVPTDSEGVIVEALEKLISEHQEKFGETSEKRPYCAMFYTIPVFHNPTSVSLSPERCTALIKVLRKHNVLAVCDDVYNFINWDSKPPPRRLFTYDIKSDSDYIGHVVSNGTFSKIVAPGLRLGWLEAPEIVIGRIIFSAIIGGGGGVNQYTSAIMGTALKHGIFSQYFTDLINSSKKKMEMVCDALDKYAKPYVKYGRPTGGYFIWVELPPDCNALAFQKYCVENYKVSIRSGACFSPSGSCKNFFRLCYSFIDEEQIDEGIRKMATALEEFLKQ